MWHKCGTTSWQLALFQLVPTPLSVLCLFLEIQVDSSFRVADALATCD